MNPSPVTIGVVMIALGVVPHLMARANGASPTVLGIVVAAALVAGGLGVVLRRSVAFFVAMGAGLFTAATGVAGLALGREVGLPLPPIVSIVAGLYICLRIAIARRSLGSLRPPRASRIADDEPGDD